MAEDRRDPTIARSRGEDPEGNDDDADPAETGASSAARPTPAGDPGDTRTGLWAERQVRRRCIVEELGRIGHR